MKNGVFWDITPCGSCQNPGSTLPNIPEDAIFQVIMLSNFVKLQPSLQYFVIIFKFGVTRNV
jgi:hypothetical protein